MKPASIPKPMLTKTCDFPAEALIQAFFLNCADTGLGIFYHQSMPVLYLNYVTKLLIS
jgi:hypothetical protein